MSAWNPNRCLDCGTGCKGARCRACFDEARRTNNQPRTGSCKQCGKRCRSKGGICRACIDLSRGAATPSTLTGGRWMAVGGIQRYVKWTEAECAERAERARNLLHRQRVKALLDERYTNQTWWKRPDVIPATPQTGNQRLDEIAADFDSHDARFRPTREVA